jgi:hypothetical protein
VALSPKVVEEELMPPAGEEMDRAQEIQAWHGKVFATTESAAGRLRKVESSLRALLETPDLDGQVRNELIEMLTALQAAIGGCALVDAAVQLTLRPKVAGPRKVA